ncbi:MAG: hypothetical protein JSW71_03035, partial [Gemmatimonadota bacterium]
MSKHKRCVVVSILATLAVVLLLVSCLSEPSAPRTGRAYLTVVPHFASAVAHLVEITHVRAILTRIDDGSEALNTLVEVDPQDSVVDLTLNVVITPPEEQFLLTIECLNPAGEVVFRGGPIEVTATTPTDAGAVEQQVDVEYVGVGSDAVAVRIIDPLPTVDFGDTIQLNAAALNSAGEAIPGTPIDWTSLNTNRATVSSPSYPVGLVAGESERGTVAIVASTLTGQTDTVTITVVAVPSAIAIVAGDNQVGFSDSPLPAPIVVQVTAVDDLGVEGVQVDFSTADGGSFGTATTSTDASGQASTTWRLGPAPGTQTATATVAGLGPVTFNATVQGGVAWISPSDGNWSNAANWSTGTIPGPSDAVVISIEDDVFVNLDVDATIAGLLMESQTGSATLLIGSNSLTLNGPGTLADGGEIRMSGAIFGGTGILTVDGTFDWTGGTITGTGEVHVASDGLIWLRGGVKYLRGGRVIRVFGQSIWTAGDVLAGENCVLRIEDGGYLNLNGDVNFNWDTGAQSTLVNEGTIRRYGGTGTASFTGRFNNLGMLDVRSGTVSLAGSNNIIADTIYIGSGAVLDLAGAGQTLSDGLLVTDTSSLAPGTLRISGDVTVAANDTIATSVDLPGTLNVIGGTTVLTGSSVVGTVGGSVSIAPTGALEFYQTSGHTFTPTSSVSGQGTFRARRSGVTVSGSYSVGSTDITADFIGGLLSFDGTAGATTAALVVRDGGERGGSANLTVTDTFDFQAGDLAGAGVTQVAAGATLTFTTASIKALSNGHTLAHAGTAVVLDGGLRLKGDALLDIQTGGVFDLQTDAFSVSFENTGNRISNAGIFRKSAGSGTNSIVAAVPFTNAAGGVVDIGTGSLSIGNFNHSAGAAVQGNGTLALGTVTAFEGDVKPGTSPGRLNITGDMPQGSQSTITVDLEGTAVGTGYDQLNVSGLATLDGDLNINWGFTPSVGATFTVLTFGSRSGSFANIIGLDV